MGGMLGALAVVLQLLLLPCVAASPLHTAGDDAFYHIGDVVFAHFKSERLVFQFPSPEIGTHMPLSSHGGQLAVEAATEASDGQSLWAVGNGELLRVAPLGKQFSTKLLDGVTFSSIETHPQNPDCVLLNGDSAAGVICLPWDEPPSHNLLTEARNCVFVGDEPTDAVCLTRAGALLSVSTDSGSSSVEIDHDSFSGVETLVRTPTHAVAVVRAEHRIRIAVYPNGERHWRWMNLPETHVSDVQVADDKETLMVIAGIGDHPKRYELWTANIKSTKFTRQLLVSKGASVKRIGRALYTESDKDEVVMSKNNGRSWQSDLATTLDVASVITSDRLNVGFNADHTMIASSYNGFDWTLSPLPPKKGHAELLLIDDGSTIASWSRGAEQSKVSLSDGTSWRASDLSVDLSGYSRVTAYSVGPEIVWIGHYLALGTIDVVKGDLTSWMGNRACSSADLTALKDSECVLGVRGAHWVRTSDCVMGPSSALAAPEPEFCECAIADYECDDEFTLVGEHMCKPGHNLTQKLAKCVPGERQHVSKGYTRIAGDRCRRGQDMSGLTYHDCESGEMMASTAGQNVVARTKQFEGRLDDYIYLPSTSESRSDETVLMWSANGDLFVSQDQGTAWDLRSDLPKVLEIYKSDTPANQVVVYNSESVREHFMLLSSDRARTFEKVSLPARPELVFGLALNTIKFHPDHPDWIMFTGAVGECDAFFECPHATFVSKDKGKTWKKLLDDASSCLWITGLVDSTNEDLTYCLLPDGEPFDKDFAFNLVYSEDYFTSEAKKIPGLEKVAGLAVETPFVVVALRDPDTKSMVGHVSLNGKDFARQRIPPSVKVDPQQGLTLISTRTQSILMFVTTNSRMAHQFGVVLKSNANGTDYVETLADVNRGFGLFGGNADFERIKSIEGVILANVVSNTDDVVNRGDRKQLKTLISHSDGSLWAPLTAPAGMCDGKPNCNLHLHSYTDRLDGRNSPSSPTAVGLIISRGSVGEQLESMRNSQTYMSRDAGISWIKIADRPMYWEFGDSGSIIVLIDSHQQTNKILYSVDEGDSWYEFQFSENLIEVVNIASIPSDSSRKFIVFGSPPVSQGDTTVAIQIDFSGIAPNQCQKSDFELWTPSHPQTKSPCLFGREVQYERKIRGRACYVGKSFTNPDGSAGMRPVTSKPCKCQRSDYECDFNYRLDPKDGTCRIVPGLDPLDREQQCEGGAISWHRVTGYRKIPISSCEGGEILVGAESACPGKEDEFNKKPSIPDGGSGGSDGPSSPPSSGRSFLGKLFLIVLVVAMVAICAASIMWAKSRGWISSVQLADTGNASELFSSGADRSLGFLEKALQQASELWAMAVSHIPLIGRQSPTDHMGFYSRMGDEERYRVLDSDEFEDDDSDAEAERPAQYRSASPENRPDPE